MIRQEAGQILNPVLKNIEIPALLQQLSYTKYSFAAWRLPMTDEMLLLIDITSGNKEESTEIEALDHCFLINSYENSHPPRPLVLKGDIVIRFGNGQQQTKLSPTLSAGQLEQFLDDVSNAHPEQDHRALPGYVTPDFHQIVQTAIDTIRSGAAQKIVVSRYHDFELGKDFLLYPMFQRLCASYPGAFCYVARTPRYGLWIGATPERLLSIGDGKIFRTDSLAGTQVLHEGQSLCDAAWTQKEIEEQALVSRYIIDCFKKIRLREYQENGPKTVQAGNLAHLKTEFSVDMHATNSPDLGSMMLNLLHPTSAVCGTPREGAHGFIREHEGYERGLYSGFLGPVNFDRSTHLFVNLRCMEVTYPVARLYAGAGITEDSIPEKEYQETWHKMQTLLSVMNLSPRLDSEA